MLHLQNFVYGPVMPGLGFLVSCVGVFLGLRCVTRARACEGAARTRWLLLAGVSIGSIGVWAMDFVARLGFAVSGETARYNVPVTIASLLVAAVAVTSSLLIIERGEDESRTLSLGGLLAGLAVAVTHYLGMAAMRMPGRLSYFPALVLLSVALAIVAATAALWAAARLRGIWATLGASLVLGVILCGVHYSAMAAVRMSRAKVPGGMVVGGGSGSTAQSLMLPVILCVSVVVFLVWAAIALSPTEDAILYDAALLDYIRRRETRLGVKTGAQRASRKGYPASFGNGASGGSPPEIIGGLHDWHEPP